MDEKHSNEIDGNVKRSFCKKLFRMERGLRRHCRITNYQTNLNTQPTDSKPPDKPENIKETSTYKWGEYTNKQFAGNASSIYEKNISFFYLLVKVGDVLEMKQQGQSTHG